MSLWVIDAASRCVSCSQHLVVVVSENTGTALLWKSNGRCQRVGYGGSSLESKKWQWRRKMLGDRGVLS